MPEIEVEHTHGRVRLVRRTPDPAGRTDRSNIAVTTAAEARQLARELTARADEADSYRRKFLSDEITRLEADIAARQERLAELRREADAPAP